MKTFSNIVLHLARPAVGNQVRDLVREFGSLAGVARVERNSRFGRLLRIEFDAATIRGETLLAHARRRWLNAQLIGVRPDSRLAPLATQA